MIIDLILDRKEGMAYSPREFYNSVMSYYNAFPAIVEPIANALDNKADIDIKKELCTYIIDNGYNQTLCAYINETNWLDKGGEVNEL